MAETQHGQGIRPPLSAVEAMAEATHLRQLHRLFLRQSCRLFPITVPGEEAQRVLDITCGCGAWAIDLAKAYPQIAIIGLDSDVQLIRIASENARIANVPNVHFAPYTLGKRPPYPLASFDIIHMQRPITRIPLQAWPALLLELRSFLRPCGYIILSDFEIGPNSSPASLHFLHLLRETLQQAQCSISSDSRPFTPAVFFPRLLRQADYADVHYTLTPIDLGKQQENQLHNQTILHLFANASAAHFLVRQGVLTQTEMHELLAQIRHEVQDIGFCGTGMLITTVGQKPLFTATDISQEGALADGTA